MASIVANGQELITTSGDYFVQGSTSLSWSIGEPVSETFSSSTNYLTQGFQQNYEDFVGLIPTGFSPSFDVYPNPFSQTITIEWETIHQATQLTLVDSQGKLFYSENVSNSAFKKQLSFDTLAPGIYFLSIRSENGTIAITKRIMKIQL